MDITVLIDGGLVRDVYVDGRRYGGFVVVDLDGENTYFQHEALTMIEALMDCEMSSGTRADHIRHILERTCDD